MSLVQCQLRAPSWHLSGPSFHLHCTKTAMGGGEMRKHQVTRKMLGVEVKRHRSKSLGTAEHWEPLIYVPNNCHMILHSIGRTFKKSLFTFFGNQMFWSHGTAPMWGNCSSLTNSICLYICNVCLNVRLCKYTFYIQNKKLINSDMDHIIQRAAGFCILNSVTVSF